MQELLRLGASINARSTAAELTPAHLAVSCGSLEVLRVLLDAGANLSLKGKAGADNGQARVQSQP